MQRSGVTELSCITNPRIFSEVPTAQLRRLIARETLQMASVQEIKGYLVERYRDLGLINLVEMYR